MDSGKEEELKSTLNTEKKKQSYVPLPDISFLEMITNKFHCRVFQIKNKDKKPYFLFTKIIRQPSS
jgi:hypothetical protein